MRSRNERQEWKLFTNDEKQKVIKRCIQRKKRKNSQPKVKSIEVAPEAIPEENRQPSLLEPLSKTQSAENSQETSNLDFSEFEL
jgi:predicted Fe-S protein YdhL (DUF1289 family)